MVQPTVCCGHITLMLHNNTHGPQMVQPTVCTGPITLVYTIINMELRCSNQLSAVVISH